MSSGTIVHITIPERGCVDIERKFPTKLSGSNPLLTATKRYVCSTKARNIKKSVLGSFLKNITRVFLNIRLNNAQNPCGSVLLCVLVLCG
jgi:hypothetical protein